MNTLSELIEQEKIMKRIDVLESELKDPNILYHNHSKQLEEIRTLNVRYHEITGCWYAFDMERRA